jgi:hypothetical protein
MFAIFRQRNGHITLVDVCGSEQDAQGEAFNLNRLYSEEQQSIFYYKRIK